MKKIHIGTMGWSYDFWKGNFYPEGAKELLTEYAKNLNTVEIDNPFYRILSMDTVKKWKEECRMILFFQLNFPVKLPISKCSRIVRKSFMSLLNTCH